MGRKFVCAALVVVVPVSLMADDSGAAMLHHNGGVLLNGNPAPLSSAIFLNDFVQTQPQREAKINAAGSSVTVEPATRVQFEGEELVLDQGTLLVSTSRELRVRVGCITVVPATAAWTQYDVTDFDGKVTVAARKSDVNIESGDSRLKATGSTVHSLRVTVREGEQKTREEKCGVAQKSPDHVPAKDGFLNSPLAKWVATGAIVLGTCLVLCHDDDPVSPSRP